MTAFVLAPVPSAGSIFLDWYTHARDVLKFQTNDPLFSQTLVVANPVTMAFEVKGLSRDSWANAAPVRDIFKQAFAHVGLPYFSPHSFRNTIVQWAEKSCTPLEFKAISQNLGHEHAMTTYNCYGKLNERDQITAIANLGKVDVAMTSIPTNKILDELARRTGK